MNTPAAPPETFYSIKDLAALFAVHTATVRGLIADGQLTTVRIRGQIRVTPEEFRRFLAANTVRGGDA